MKEIFVKIQHCLACRTCELECAVAHSVSKDLLNAVKEEPLPSPRVKVKTTKNAKAVPAQCRHCKKPLCIVACEKDAITKDPETGLTIIDNKACIGCQTFDCAEACPLDAIVIEKDKKIVLVCDQCVETGDPACIKACPTGVFALKEPTANGQ